MIKFHDLPTNESAHSQMVNEMTHFGFDRDEAEQLADIACAIVLATLRSLDDKVIEAVSDEDNRTIVQQLILLQLIGISRRGMSVNAVQHLNKILGGSFD